MAGSPWTIVEGRAALPETRGGWRWNGSCSMTVAEPMATFAPHVRLARRLRTAVIGALGLIGCDLAERLEDAVEDVVVTRSAGAVSTKANLALVTEVFAGEPALATLDLAAARARAVELLELRLSALQVVGCDPQLTSDRDAGTLDAVVVGCRIGLIHLDGDLHAEVEIETTPCDAGECPSAVVWRLDEASEFSIGAALVRPRLIGSVTFRDPVDAALPMTWETGPDFMLENRFGAFATRSSASWRVDADRCVSDMQLEARLVRIDGDDAEDDIAEERDVGTIVVAAEDLDRCPAKCPTSGTVRLSFGGGRVLQWDYDGRSLDVLAPGGRHFDAELDCAE